MQLPVVILKKSFISDMHHPIRYTYKSHFSKIGFFDRSNPCTQMYLQKIAICINLQLPTTILKKSIMSDMSDMHHRIITYMHINFQQNRASRSVKNRTHNFVCKNRKLHRLAATNSNFEYRLLQTCIIV